jgi:hypothetical protein
LGARSRGAVGWRRQVRPTPAMQLSPGEERRFAEFTGHDGTENLRQVGRAMCSTGILIAVGMALVAWIFAIAAAVGTVARTAVLVAAGIVVRPALPQGLLPGRARRADAGAHARQYSW